MKAHLAYLKYVLRHKWYVFQECWRLRLPWRANVHGIVTRCAAGEKVFDWWDDWAKCLAWATYLHGVEDDTIKWATERTPDAMTRRYIEQFVRTCKAESRADEAEAELAAIVQQLIEQGKDAAPDPNWEQTLDNL